MWSDTFILFMALTLSFIYTDLHLTPIKKDSAESSDSHLPPLSTNTVLQFTELQAEMKERNRGYQVIFF